MNSLEELTIKDQRVLVRVDFNVSLDADGAVQSDRRIQAVLPTIRYLLEGGARIVLMSHLGRPTGDEEHDRMLKLDRVADRLRELLPDVEINKCDEVVGPAVRRQTADLRPGQIMLLENLRFHPGEKSGDPSFARQLRELGDLYVNDAFAVCHRKHASVETVARFFAEDQRSVGLLIMKELAAIDRIMDSAQHPIVVVLGGAKVSDKIQLIDALRNRSDLFLIGGQMAFTFLRAAGVSVGSSFVDSDQLPMARRMLEGIPGRFVLPTDHRIAHHADGSGEQTTIEADIDDGWYGLDIGPQTIESFHRTIMKAGTVIWNGPLGKFENELFRAGTETIARAIVQSKAISLVGGGETGTAVEQLGLVNELTHLSTGGGAFLTYLETGSLPALTVLDEIEVTI